VVRLDLLVVMVLKETHQYFQPLRQPAAVAVVLLVVLEVLAVLEVEETEGP
jgi:hypothetical protein